MMVVDLQHWLLPSGELHPGATHAPHVALVVEAATFAGLPTFSTSMVCRHRDARRRCRGTIDVNTTRELIEWHCSRCDDGGAITGWAGTRWDLSETDIAPDDESLVVYVALDELRAMRDLDLAPTTRAVLAAAPLVEAEHACVELTEEELVVLMHAVMASPARGRTRSRLDVALGRIEQARLAHQLPRRARAH